jgi:hypothetical protein
MCSVDAQVCTKHCEGVMCLRPLFQVVVQCTGLTSLHIPFPARRLITAMPRLALYSHAQAIARDLLLVEAPASHAVVDRHVPSSKSKTGRWTGLERYEGHTINGQEQQQPQGDQRAS